MTGLFALLRRRWTCVCVCDGTAEVVSVTAFLSGGVAACFLSFFPPLSLLSLSLSCLFSWSPYLRRGCIRQLTWEEVGNEIALSLCTKLRDALY
jgi:hypothetical protein